MTDLGHVQTIEHAGKMTRRHCSCGYRGMWRPGLCESLNDFCPAATTTPPTARDKGSGTCI